MFVGDFSVILGGPVKILKGRMEGVVYVCYFLLIIYLKPDHETRH